MRTHFSPLLLLALLLTACGRDHASNAPAPLNSPAATAAPATATPTSALPERFYLVGEASATLQVLAGTTPKGDLYVVTTNGYVPAPGGQPCIAGGEVRTNGAFLRASRKLGGFTLSASGQHPNTPSFHLEADGAVTPEGQASGTVRITSATCDTGQVPWSGRLVSDQEFAAVLAALTRQEVLDQFGLAVPSTSVDLAAMLPLTEGLRSITQGAATATTSAPQRPAPGTPPAATTMTPTVRLPQPIRIPEGCQEWLQEVIPLLLRLPVPEGLCWHSGDVPKTQVACNNFIPAPGCYLWRTRTINTLTSGVQATLPKGLDLPKTYPLGLAHEICHAHQHWQILNSGLGEPKEGPGGSLVEWFDTAQGKAFSAAASAASASATNRDGSDYPLYTNAGAVHPREMFAEVCAAWSVRGVGPVEAGAYSGWVERWPPLKEFVELWLP